jgi:hypothetical protein
VPSCGKRGARRAVRDRRSAVLGGPTRCSATAQQPTTTAMASRSRTPEKASRKAVPPGIECQLCGTLVLDGRRLPAGRCWLRHSQHEATLYWAEADGVLQTREISFPVLGQLLQEGLLQRLA